MKKRLFLILTTVFILLLLGACGKEKGEKVKIGVTGSDGQYWDIIKEKAANEGIEIELVEFSDYTIPNKALADGEIDLNAFQHMAFLNEFKKEHHLDITPLGTTQIAPMGMYSEKFTSPDDIPDGAEIAIPDDPTNQARALKLLESAGLIELKADFEILGDMSGIANNPKQIKITPIVAQQTPRVLPDVAASIINNGVAGQAGFIPTEDAIYLEDPNKDAVKPYINIIAVRTEDIDNETYKKIIDIYHEDEVVEAIKKDTNGGSIVVNIPMKELKNIIE